MVRMVRAACVTMLASLSTVGTALAGEMPFGDGGGGPVQVAVTSFRDMPFRTVVRQKFDFSCGSAALATLLRHHFDRALGEGDIFKAMFEKGDQDKIRQQGFSLLDMKNYLEAVGYRADGFRAPLDRLREMRLPAIALITLKNYRHFVVVKNVAADRVLVGDPSLGLKTYNRAEFEKMWNGLLFVIHGGPGIELARARFEAGDEWKLRVSAPLSTAVDREGLGSEALRIPYPSQVSTIFSLDPYFK